MQSNATFITKANEILAELDQSPSLDGAFLLCNEILKLIGIQDTKPPKDIIDEGVIPLPNAERYDHWFQNHPWMSGERATFQIVDNQQTPLQARLYWLNKHSRQYIAGAVQFSENWEDSDYTHNSNFRVGIDFFLSPSGRSIQVVLSNRGNLRIVELAKKLNNTHVEIFTKWEGLSQLTVQESLHSSLWDSFKLKSVNQKFYDGVANSFNELLSHLKANKKGEEESKLFASRLLGRLLFCWFLRKKGIVDETMGYFSASGIHSTHYYKNNLEKLFFLTLNTPIDERDELHKQHQKQLFQDIKEDTQTSLFRIDQKTPYLNGGLFEPRENDWFQDEALTFPEGFFVNLYNHFEEFNFTTDESSPEYEQVAIDPEMLGRVFESLLATQIDETGQQARKAKGAFYTPREIVSYMCKESLRNYLYTATNNDEDIKSSIDGLLDISDSEWAKAGTNSKRDTVKSYRAQIIEALDTVTVLDPACGSGAFPMGMLQLCTKVYERLEGRFDPYKTKLQIIQNNIFGIDIEPMAVEIARLRAWLSLIVDEEDSRSVEPLPNLDFKFVCANSLIPLDEKRGLFSDPQLHQKLKDIRTKYFNARKPRPKRALQEEYYKLTNSEQMSIISDDIRTKQLKSFDPFRNSNPADFFDSDHMFGIDSGFDIVIGNPPYVRQEKIEDKSALQGEYKIYNAVADLYTYFYEKGFELLKGSGVLTFITSNKFLRARYGISLRDYLKNNLTIKNVINFGNKHVFEAVTNTLILIATKENTEGNALSSSDDINEPNKIKFFQDELRSSEWTIETAEIIHLKNKIERLGTPLKDWDVQINYGIKTGLNEAFIIDEITKNELIDKDPKSKDIIKPIIRGRDIIRWNYLDNVQYLITTFPSLNLNIELFPAIKSHLLKFGKERLEQTGKILQNGITARKKTFNKWYETQDQISYYKDFQKDKIIWIELTNKNKFAYSTKEDYVLAGAFLMTGESLKYLNAFLNSKLCLFYFSLICNSSGMATIQWKKFALEKVPVKKLSEKDQEPFIDLVEKVLEITKGDDYLINTEKQAKVQDIEHQLDELVYKLYGLTDGEIKIIENAAPLK